MNVNRIIDLLENIHREKINWSIDSTKYSIILNIRSPERNIDHIYDILESILGPDGYHIQYDRCIGDDIQLFEITHYQSYSLQYLLLELKKALYDL